MMFFRIAMLFTAVFFVFGAQAFCADWADSAQKVLGQAKETRERGENLVRTVESRRKELLEERAGLERRIQKAKTAYETRKETFETLLKREKELKSSLGEEEKELELVEGVLRGVARDTLRLLDGKPPSLAVTQGKKMLDRIVEQGVQSGFEDARSLVAILFDAMRQSGSLIVYEDEYVGLEGELRKGRMARAGWASAYYSGPGESGFLIWDPVLENFTAVSERRSSEISNWFAGETDVLPIDMSNGAAFQEEISGGGFLGWLNSGGPVVWPIIISGALALVLVLERFYSLGGLRASNSGFLQELNSKLSEGDIQSCRERCSREKRSPTCRVLQAGLDHKGAPRDVLENAFHEAILKEIPRLERFLPTIGMLGAVAPLLGLLGTVSGMITTFRAMTLYGSGNPSIMSGGISEALITTQLGLAVAVPIILSHHFLERKVEGILGDMEEKSVAFTVTLLNDSRSGNHA